MLGVPYRRRVEDGQGEARLRARGEERLRAHGRARERGLRGVPYAAEVRRTGGQTRAMRELPLGRPRGAHAPGLCKLPHYQVVQRRGRREDPRAHVVPPHGGAPPGDVRELPRHRRRRGLHAPGSRLHELSRQGLQGRAYRRPRGQRLSHQLHGVPRDHRVARHAECRSRDALPGLRPHRGAHPPAVRELSPHRGHGAAVHGQEPERLRGLPPGGLRQGALGHALPHDLPVLPLRGNVDRRELLRSRADGLPAGGHPHDHAVQRVPRVRQPDVEVHQAGESERLRGLPPGGLRPTAHRIRLPRDVPVVPQRVHVERRVLRSLDNEVPPRGRAYHRVVRHLPRPRQPRGSALEPSGLRGVPPEGLRRPTRGVGLPDHVPVVPHPVDVERGHLGPRGRIRRLRLDRTARDGSVHDLPPAAGVRTPVPQAGEQQRLRGLPPEGLRQPTRGVRLPDHVPVVPPAQHVERRHPGPRGGVRRLRS